MFTPIQNKRMYMLIVDQIKELIDTEKLKTGDRLPSERELANRLNLSRSTAREAITALEIMGLVEVKPGLGTFVISPRQDQPFADISNELYTATSPTDIFEARILIEPQLSRLAAQRSTREDLEAMLDILDKAADLGRESIEEFEKLDAAFHLAIAKASHNEALYRFEESINSERLSKLWGSLKLNSLQKEGRMEKYKKEHYDILCAIKDRNSSLSEKLTRKHLDDIRMHIFGF